MKFSSNETDQHLYCGILADTIISIHFTADKKAKIERRWTTDLAIHDLKIESDKIPLGCIYKGETSLLLLYVSKWELEMNMW